MMSIARMLHSSAGEMDGRDGHLSAGSHKTGFQDFPS
jgi:hypothetical protein